MRALEQIQRRHPSCHALIVGGDEVSYGQRPKGAASWREKMLGEVKLDAARTHFLGRVPFEQYVRVLQVSAAHVYLTYPFVLSWSVLEAMACGTPIVASDTAPVRELITAGRNGRLVDFFDPHAMAQTTLDAVEGQDASTALAAQARSDVQRYSQQRGLHGYDRLLEAAGSSLDAPNPAGHG
jgi:glycosyltransferase involved in cell wall biosynthesis